MTVFQSDVLKKRVNSFPKPAYFLFVLHKQANALCPFFFSDSVTCDDLLQQTTHVSHGTLLLLVLIILCKYPVLRHGYESSFFLGGGDDPEPSVKNSHKRLHEPILYNSSLSRRGSLKSCFPLPIQAGV